MEYEIVPLLTRGDERGYLVAIEENKDINFDIKRVYYIFDTDKNIRRGFHAHYKTRQFAIAVYGSCTFLLDDGRSKVYKKLDTANKGIYIEPMIWHEMYDFSENCVLLVLADEYYDESDYIRNYNDFISLVKIGK